MKNKGLRKEKEKFGKGAKKIGERKEGKDKKIK